MGGGRSRRVVFHLGEATALALEAGGEEGVALVCVDLRSVDRLDEVDVSRRGLAGVSLVLASAHTTIHVE